MLAVCLAAAAVTVWYSGSDAERAQALSPACSTGCARFDPSHVRPVRIAEYHALDVVRVGGADVPIAGRTGPISLGNAQMFEIRGWAVDAAARRPSSAVYAVFGTKTITGRMGDRRDDVAAAFHWPPYANSGFAIDIPVDAVPAGVSAIVLHAVTADSRGSYALMPPVAVVKP
jgi:hypothetical protein